VSLRSSGFGLGAFAVLELGGALVGCRCGSAPLLRIGGLRGGSSARRCVRWPRAPACQRGRAGLGLSADFGEFFLDDLQAARETIVFLALEGGLLDFEGVADAPRSSSRWGREPDLDGEAAAASVDQIDGPCPQEAVRRCSGGGGGAATRAESLMRDLVVRLVALAQAAQDGRMVSSDLGLATKTTWKPAARRRRPFSIIFGYSLRVVCADGAQAARASAA